MSHTDNTTVGGGRSSTTASGSMYARVSGARRHAHSPPPPTRGTPAAGLPRTGILAEPALYKKTRKLNLSPVSAAIRGLIAYNNAAEWETINNDARRQTLQTQHAAVHARLRHRAEHNCNNN